MASGLLRGDGQPDYNPSSSDYAERRVEHEKEGMGGRVRNGGRRGSKGSPVYPRWAWVLCSFLGSVQSFSLSLSLPGAAARVHTARMTSKADFSALGPVGSHVADNELFTIAHAENLRTTAAERKRGARTLGQG